MTNAAPSSSSPSVLGTVFGAPFRWIRSLYDWVLSWSNRPGGAIALGAISFAESSFFPVPPDPLLCALCLGNRRKSLFFAGVTTVTSVLGGIFGWFIGMYFFADVVLWGISAFGLEQSWFGTPDSLAAGDQALMVQGTAIYPDGLFFKANKLFGEWGFLAMFVAALTPIPYKVATIASGVFGMALAPMVLGSVLGRGMRFFAEGILLFFFGDLAKRIIDKHFALITVVLAILLVGGFYALGYVL